MSAGDTFPDRIWNEILERLGDGEPLLQIVQDSGMPKRRTVYDKREADAEFSAQFARAREIGFDAIAERTMLIARGMDGSTGDVQRDKMIIENDNKLLAKWDRLRYGDGQKKDEGDGDRPIHIEIVNPNGKD